MADSQAKQSWWKQLYSKFVQGDNAAIVDKKMPWFSIGTKHITSHDVKVQLGVDFSSSTSATLITLGLMALYAARLRVQASRASEPVAPLRRSRRSIGKPGPSAPARSSWSWFGRSGTMSVAGAGEKPAPVQVSQSKSSTGSTRRRLLQLGGLGVFAFGCWGAWQMAMQAFARPQMMLLSMGEDDDAIYEDASRIKGSRKASLVVAWPDLREKLAGGERQMVGVVDLGGIRWKVVAAYRNNGALLGIYLMHRDGTKDQIAFTIKVVDVSARAERVIAEERFRGNWVFMESGSVLPGLASDGQGTCVDVVDLYDAKKLRIDFHALGPATKHADAL